MSHIQITHVHRFKTVERKGYGCNANLSFNQEFLRHKLTPLLNWLTLVLCVTYLIHMPAADMIYTDRFQSPENTVFLYQAET